MRPIAASTILNIFNYNFPDQAYYMVKEFEKHYSMNRIAAKFGFIQVSICMNFSKFPHKQTRRIYKHQELGIILKSARFKNATLNHTNLCPTITFLSRVKRAWQIQPICEEKTIEERRIWSKKFADQLPEYDIHSGNVFFLNDLPAIIDW